MNTKKINKKKLLYKGLIIIISSPSGAGKTSLCKKISSLNKNINLSISYTTRKKRKIENEGEHYRFVNIKKFNKMKKNNLFLESAKVFGNNYGTPLKETINKIKLGKDVLLDIDWQGARQIRKKFPEYVVDFFIMPPTINELRKRLIKRGQDDIKIVNKRMKMAFGEIKHYNDYKYILINDNFNNTLKKILNIIKMERIQRIDILKINKKFNIN
tara:strand:- start:679 stop:1320 length:642 start_codon:yes stop_codon:yes gene_type:complete